jgi:putative flavoprotein involved in K+ transport
VESVDTVVVGAGQAGLATSYFLTQHDRPHVVLERGRVGERWRSERWDGFVLNTPNWAQRLPGFHYAGPEPDAFAPRAEVLEYLEGYARSFGAPVREHAAVTAVRRTKDGFRWGAVRGFRVETAVVSSSSGSSTRVSWTRPWRRCRRLPHA